jgi:hypothetical protein
MATINFVVKNGLVVTEGTNINSTTDSASSSDTLSSLYVAGGVAIAKKLHVGTEFSVGSNVTLSGDLAVNGGDITTTATTFNLINANATNVNFAGAATTLEIGAATGTTNINNNLDVDGDVNIDGGDLTVSTTTFNLANTTATTGNLFGAGTTITIGAATGTTNIRHNLDVDGDVNIDGGDLTVSTSTFNLANANATTGNLFGAATTLNLANTASAQTVSIGNASTGASTYNLGTGATSTGNTKTVNLGTGGVTGSTTNVNIGSTIGSTTTVNSGTLVGALTTQNVFNTVATVVNAFGAAGTIGIGATSGTLTVNNPTVVGTQTTVNLWDTTSTTVNAFGAATAVNIGANTGTATLRNPTVVGTQTTVNLWNTTSTTVNAFGAATSIVMGAATGTTSIRNNLDVDGTVNIDGNSLTTSAATFNLINTNATAVNFAGAATALEIGAATGTTNINNNLDVDGDVNIDGGDLTVSTATFNLANTTATTGNLFGAGTAVNIGAATGTLTVGNPTLTMTNGTAFNMNGANPSIASSNTGTASIFNENITAVNFGQAADISMGSTTGLVTARGRLTVSATTASTSTATGALTVGGGAGIGGAVFVGGGVNIAGTQAAINTTTPGTGQYGLHFNGQSTADSAVGITFNGGTTASNANAGIYVQGSGAYGTRMFIATTDSYAAGSKTAISINESGVTNFARARPTALGNVIIDAGNISSYVFNGTLSMGVSGVGLSGSASFTANQSGASTFTVTSNATDANTASTIVARNASGNFSAGTITASLSGNATSANQVNNSVTFNNAGSGDASGTTFNGSAARTISYNTIGAPSTTGTNASGTWAIAITGNAATATNLSTNRTNWSTNGTISAVVGQLAWKNYNNNHTIFDASASTSPDGGAVSNTNAAVAWTGTYPTLMGWNGSTTYGVRVDSARVADNGGVTSISATTPIAVNQSTGAVTISHTNSGVTAGTYNNVTVNATGHVTSGSNVAYLTGFTETDTLATVTGRGASTSTACTFTGNVNINTPASLLFGSQTRQMINLWSTNYGLGVQSSTTYFRSDSRFSWHRGGTHNDSENNAGGGVVAMTLDSSSNLIVTGGLIASANSGIGTSTPQYRLDVNSGAGNNFAASFGTTFSVGQWSGIHFGYSESANQLYRKSAIVFERTDNGGGGGNAAGRVHILNGPATTAGSATLADARLTINETGNIIQAVGLYYNPISGSVSAAGTTQGTATLLTTTINNITTVAASSGVVLPTPVQAGARMLIRNGGANILRVYPNSGAQINSLGTNVALQLEQGALIEFVAFTTTQWYTVNATFA